MRKRLRKKLDRIRRRSYFEHAFVEPALVGLQRQHGIDRVNVFWKRRGLCYRVREFKVPVLDADGVVVGWWGYRPSAGRSLVKLVHV